MQRPARADDEARDAALFDAVTPVRRGGVAVGVALGFALGSSSGYPNDARKIGFPVFYSDPELGAGGAVTAWVGRSLSDWLTVGVGLLHERLLGNSRTAEANLFVVRLETYPLWSLDGAFRDLGLALNAGTGHAGGWSGNHQVFEATSPSLLGLSVYYEGLSGGSLSTGPYIGVDHVFGDSVELSSVSFGLRTSLYSRP